MLVRTAGHERRPGVVGEPRADHLDDPAAHDLGRERSAVEQDGVGPCGGPVLPGWWPSRRDRLGPVPAQEVAQMLGHGRIGHERQAELLQAALGGPLGISRRVTAREETVERDRLDLLHASAPTGCCRRSASSRGRRSSPASARAAGCFAQQLFLGRPAGEPQGTPLLGVEPRRRRASSRRGAPAPGRCYRRRASGDRRRRRGGIPARSASRRP